MALTASTLQALTQGSDADTWRVIVEQTVEIARKPLAAGNAPSEVVRRDREIGALLVGTVLTDSKTIASKDAASTRAHQAIMKLFAGEGQGATLKGVDGTAWGLVNAVTEYVDHHARAKTDQHRLSDAFFGRGDQLKSLTFGRALDMLPA